MVRLTITLSDGDYQKVRILHDKLLHDATLGNFNLSGRAFLKQVLYAQSLTLKTQNRTLDQNHIIKETGEKVIELDVDDDIIVILNQLRTNYDSVTIEQLAASITMDHINTSFHRSFKK